jgi:hypothetical protein
MGPRSKILPVWFTPLIIVQLRLEGHFTPSGHAVIAQALARFLREQHLLDSSVHGWHSALR